MQRKNSASHVTANSRWPDLLVLLKQTVYSLLFLFFSFSGLSQPTVSFEAFSKAPALVGTNFGGAITRRSIIVRDWKDFHLYSFETKTWEKMEFPQQKIKKLHSQGWITCAYLPSFGKIITLGEELEVLDLQKLELFYYPIEGAAPVPGGAVVWKEKVYLLGSSLIFKSGSSHTIQRPWMFNTTQFLAFDPATLRFESLDTLPGPHFRLGVFIDDKLLAFGPRDDESATDVIRYDPVKDTWDSVAQLPYRVGAVAGHNQTVYLLGLQQHEGFLVAYNVVTGAWKQFRSNVPWTHGLAYVHNNQLYYLAGMKENPKIRDVFFRHPRWLDRRMFVLDIGKLPP